MIKLVCRDYGFDCDFIASGDDVKQVVDAYGHHSTEERSEEHTSELQSH